MIKDYRNLLKKFRVLSDISQIEMAIGVGISQNYLCEIEKGKKSITFEIFLKIAEFCGLTPGELFNKLENIDKFMKK